MRTLDSADNDNPSDFFKVLAVFLETMYCGKLFQSSILQSELEACSDPRQRWTVAKRLLDADNRPTKQTPITYNIALCKQFLDFFHLRLNSCAIALYVNCLTHHSLSLCLLNLHTLAHNSTLYHLSVRFPNYSPLYHLKTQFLTIYLHLYSTHLYSNHPTSYFLSW